jgi:hypothetical protein
MEPEQGNEMLFVVREANLDLTLVAETLHSSRADLISRHLLEPVKALGFRIRAVVSDADKNIRRAVQTNLPDCPHQACQVHCLCEAGAPIFEADRAMKTDLRRDLRAKLRPISRELSQAPQDDPQSAVLMDYCEALRDALRADSRVCAAGGLCRPRKRSRSAFECVSSIKSIGRVGSQAFNQKRKDCSQARQV